MKAAADAGRLPSLPMSPLDRTFAVAAPRDDGHTAPVFLVGPSGGLIAVARDVPRDEPLPAAVQALLEGPTQVERAFGLHTEVPAATELLGIELEDGIAVVDLSPVFAAGASTAAMRQRVRQLVHTCTAIPGVERVRLRIDGTPVVTLGGTGLMVAGALSRDAADAAHSA
jgi:spore germination protein GerM